MGHSAPQLMISPAVRQAVDGLKGKARMYVRLGKSWRDFRKPLGAPALPPGVAPGPLGGPPVGLAVKGINMVAGQFGMAMGAQGAKGRALRAGAALAGDIQKLIVGLTQAIGDLHEPARSINLSYLQHLADATVLAAKACQSLMRGNQPDEIERLQLAVAWVVALACGVADMPLNLGSPGLMDARVRDAAIAAYPLFSAGKALKDTLDPAQAVHDALVALDAVERRMPVFG